MIKTICPHHCKDCYAMRVCAVRAISENNGSINVDTDKCIECGACRTGCVTFGYQALRLKSKIAGASKEAA